MWLAFPALFDFGQEAKTPANDNAASTTKAKQKPKAEPKAEPASEPEKKVLVN